MNQLQALRETVRLAGECGMPELPGNTLGLEHLRAMAATAEKSSFSPSKLGRWLGWAQCALVAANVGVTLEDMKALNMRHAAPVEAGRAAARSTVADGDEGRPHLCNTPYGPRCWCERARLHSRLTDGAIHAGPKALSDLNSQRRQRV